MLNTICVTYVTAKLGYFFVATNYLIFFIELLDLRHYKQWVSRGNSLHAFKAESLFHLDAFPTLATYLFVFSFGHCMKRMGGSVLVFVIPVFRNISSEPHAHKQRAVHCLAMTPSRYPKMIKNAGLKINVF